MSESESKKNDFLTSKLLILLVVFTSCKTLTLFDEYNGLWLGELKNDNIADHQIIEVENEKIYFYNLNKVVDSTHTIKGRKIISDSKSILGKVKLLHDTKNLQIKTTNGEQDNTEEFKKLTPTQLSCRIEVLDKIGKEDVEWHIVITEEGEFYCTDKIQVVKNLSKYEFSKINFLRIDNIFFLVNQNMKEKIVIAPIINIRDDEFEIYNDFEEGNLKVIWGIP